MPKSLIDLKIIKRYNLGYRILLECSTGSFHVYWGWSGPGHQHSTLDSLLVWGMMLSSLSVAERTVPAVEGKEAIGTLGSW